MLIRFLLSLTALACLSLATAATTFGQEVIVDNSDQDRTSQTGDWRVSGGPNPYGADSLFSYDGSFFWFPDLPEPGEYDVYAWWTYFDTRSTSAAYFVNLSGALDPDATIVNQRDPSLGGQWNLLGTFLYNGTDFAEVELTGFGAGSVSADAVRFVLKTPSATGEWPEVPCPCDPYFQRAVSKYIAWGGAMAPPGYGAEAETNLRLCPTGDGRSQSVVYLTDVNDRLGVSVELRVSSDDVGFTGCAATTSAAGQRIYDRRIDNITPDQVIACRASSEDYCEDDPPPGPLP